MKLPKIKPGATEAPNFRYRSRKFDFLTSTFAALHSASARMPEETPTPPREPLPRPEGLGRGVALSSSDSGALLLRMLARCWRDAGEEAGMMLASSGSAHPGIRVARTRMGSGVRLAPGRRMLVRNWGPWCPPGAHRGPTPVRCWRMLESFWNAAIGLLAPAGARLARSWRMLADFQASWRRPGTILAAGAGIFPRSPCWCPFWPLAGHLLADAGHLLADAGGSWPFPVPLLVFPGLFWSPLA